MNKLIPASGTDVNAPSITATPELVNAVMNDSLVLNEAFTKSVESGPAAALSQKYENKPSFDVSSGPRF